MFLISISGVDLQEILSLYFDFIFINIIKWHESKMCFQNKLSDPFQYLSIVKIPWLDQTRKTSLRTIKRPTPWTRNPKEMI